MKLLWHVCRKAENFIFGLGFVIFFSSCSAILHPGNSNQGLEDPAEDVTDGGSDAGDEIQGLSTRSRFLNDETTSELLTDWRSSMALEFGEDSPRVGTNFDANSLRLAVAKKADVAMAVWTQSDGIVKRVYRSVYSNGSWTHPLNAKDSVTGPTESSLNGDVVISADGSVAAILLGNKVLLYRDGAWDDEPQSMMPEGWTSTQNGRSLLLSDDGKALFAIFSSSRDSGSTYAYYVSKYDFSSNNWQMPSGVEDAISPLTVQQPQQDALAAEISATGNKLVMVYDLRNSSNEYRYALTEYNNGVWTQPANQDDVLPFITGQPRLAMSANGEKIFFAFQANDAAFAGDPQIYLATYQAGAWSWPADLDDHLSLELVNYEGRTPDVSISDDGSRAQLVWNQYDGSNSWLLASRYQDGLWVHPTTLDSALASSNRRPVLEMNPQGDKVFVQWCHIVSGQLQPKVASSNGGAWTLELGDDDLVVSENPGCPSSSYGFRVGNNGQLSIVTWAEDFGSSEVSPVYLAYKNGGGVWQKPTSIADSLSIRTRVIQDVQAAASSDGKLAVVVWVELINYQRRIYASVYDNGVWRHPASPSDVLAEGNYIESPVLRVAKNGSRAILAWLNIHDGNKWALYSAEYSGGAWTRPADESDHVGTSNEAASFYALDFALSNDGNFGIAAFAVLHNRGYVFHAVYENGVWTGPSSAADSFSFGNSRVGSFNLSYPRVLLAGDAKKAYIVYGDYGADGVMRTYRAAFDSGIWTYPASQNAFLLDAPVNPYVLFGDQTLNIIAAGGVLSADGSDGILVFSQIEKIGEENVSPMYVSTLVDGVWSDPASGNPANTFKFLGETVLNKAFVGLDGIAMASDGSYGACLFAFEDSSGEQQIYAYEFDGTSWSLPASEADTLASQVGLDNFVPTVTSFKLSSDGSSGLMLLRNSQSATSDTYSVSRKSGVWESTLQPMGVPTAAGGEIVLAPMSWARGASSSQVGTVFYKGIPQNDSETGLRFMEIDL